MDLLKQARRVTKIVLLAAGAAGVVAISHAARGAQPTGDSEATPPVTITPAATQGAATQSASTQASEQVLAVLDRLAAAYARLQSAQFDGRMTGTFEIGGEKKTEEISFTSTFHAPNRFRHVAKGDVEVGSTGQKAYAFNPGKNNYTSSDAPKDRADASAWPGPVVAVLQDQNLSLLLAITATDSKQLKELADSIIQLPPQNIDGVSFITLQFQFPNGETAAMLIDPRTSLLRRTVFDLRGMLARRGTTDVKVAEITIDYTKVATDPPVDETVFAWAPPVGAVEVTANSSPTVDDMNPAAATMIGKPPADFSLTDLNGGTVKLSKMKGSVIVLDFWATWCGPCVASLPHLNALYNEKAGKGLKVFAIDQKEEADAVKTFVEKQQWKLPVLLDGSGTVGDAYHVESIPETVLIGKDGIVKKVYLSGDEETAARISADVSMELAK